MWGPVFADVFDGSMYGAGANVFSVWVYCISHGYDGGGVVRLNPKLLASIIGSTEEEMAAAIEYLCAPDEHSASKKDHGARLLHLSGYEYGIVNWDHYQNIIRREKKRAADKERMKLKRAAAKSNNINDVADVADVAKRRKKSPMIREEKIEEKIEEESTSYSLGHPPPADDRFDEFWTLYPRKVQKKTAKTAWKNMTKKKREAALAALPAHILHWDDPKFIPHAATWLRAERWEDDLSSSKSATDHERRLLSLSKRYGVSMSAIEQFQKTRGRTPVSRQEIEEMENAT